jgi:hypothetical protein
MLKVVSFFVLMLCIDLVFGHAYFVTPIPRNVFCTQPVSSCSGSNAQGPVFLLQNVTNSRSMGNQTTQCVTSIQATSIQINPPNVTNTWYAGQTYTISIFVSEAHTGENLANGVDGWQILGRDLTIQNSVYTPLNVNVSGVVTNQTMSTASWVTGTTITATIQAPTTLSSAYSIQFFWVVLAVQPGQPNFGAAWLSCADIAIVQQPVPQPSSNPRTSPRTSPRPPTGNSRVRSNSSTLSLSLFGLLTLILLLIN